MSDYDIIIIGAGTWGSSTAWQLAERGHRVLAIDARRPPHDHGSHAGATRLARQSNSTGPEYVELTQRTFDMWSEIGRRTGKQVMVETGNIFVGRPGSRWFDNTLANLKTSHFEHEILSGTDGRARFPRVNIEDDELVVWEPRGAVSQVHDSLLAMQQLGRDAGVETRYDEPVRRWSSSGGTVTVSTDSGTYTAGRLILTVGAFSASMLGMRLPTSVERQVLANFDVDPAAARLPAMYFAPPPGDDSAPAYGCAEPDGSFKLSAPNRGDVIDPDTLSQDVTPQDLARITAIAEQRLPELGTVPVSHTVCMWTESADGHWLIGRHPDHENVVIGAGCNGRGFRYAPVVGEILSDLAESKAHPELGLFEFGRFLDKTATA
jgi:sarcosine oxidase